MFVWTQEEEVKGNVFLTFSPHLDEAATSEQIMLFPAFRQVLMVTRGYRSWKWQFDAQKEKHQKVYLF